MSIGQVSAPYPFYVQYIHFHYERRFTTGFDEGAIDYMPPVDVAGVPFRAVPASNEKFFLRDDFGPDDVPTVTASQVFTIEMVSPVQKFS
jgi:hypothetical protein